MEVARLRFGEPHGEMVEEQSVPLEIAAEVVSRIKVLSRMDIAERRTPQDGVLTLAPDPGANLPRCPHRDVAHGEHRRRREGADGGDGVGRAQRAR